MYFLLEPDEKLPKTTATGETVSANKQAWEGVVKALKNKNIWLVSFNVFLVYSVYCGLTYFIPFLSDIYALPAALAGVYGIINQYGLKMLGGPIGGYITDKVLHSATRYLRIAFTAVTVVLVVFTFLPHQSMGIILGMAISLGISAIVYSMRAIFFAPMDEVDVPREITGSAMSLGLSSAIFRARLCTLFTAVFWTILKASPDIGLSSSSWLYLQLAVFC